MDSKQNKLITEWYEAKKKLDELKAKEMELRNEVFKTVFAPETTESVQKFDLGRGFTLKATQRLSYTVNADELATMRDMFESKGINVDTLVRNKPELNKRVYKALTEDQAKLFDACMTIKWGSPTIEVVG